MAEEVTAATAAAAAEAAAVESCSPRMMKRTRQTRRFKVLQSRATFSSQLRFTLTVAPRAPANTLTSGWTREAREEEGMRVTSSSPSCIRVLRARVLVLLHASVCARVFDSVSSQHAADGVHDDDGGSEDQLPVGAGFVCACVCVCIHVCACVRVRVRAPVTERPVSERNTGRGKKQHL